MKRWIVHFMCAGSLLLFIATGVLWIRSVSSGDNFTVSISGRKYFLQTTRAGILDLGTNFSGWPNSMEYFWFPRLFPESPNAFDTPDWRFAGIGGGRVPDQIAIKDYYWLRMPLFIIMFLAALLPVWWLVSFRRRKHPPGFCRKCGYDLRQSKEHCPECGTPIPAKPTPLPASTS